MKREGRGGEGKSEERDQEEERLEGGHFVDQFFNS